ncbi:MAG: 16S rRNA (adenine(1518)-N(6)/adenine(1519)-N(6))-dimethyltransferase RsmA [Pseudomonadota bacterium]
MAASPTTLDALPPLRDVIRTHGLAAKKSLGQNFILDLNITAKIARLAGDLSAAHVIEVGPGPGGLTRSLLADGAHVTAIERDARCLPALAEVASAADGRLTVFADDALAIDYAKLTPAPYRIVANLPYSVATPLLTGWLSMQGAAPAREATTIGTPVWTSMTLMFQKEVAERIVAAPSTRAYGRLSVLAQWRSIPRIAMVLPPNVFTPPPKIDSAVVTFHPRPEPEPVPSVAALEATTAAAFGQRRKMLRASLKRLSPDAEERIAASGIDPRARAEEIPVEGFCRLARAFTPGAST